MLNIKQKVKNYFRNESGHCFFDKYIAIAMVMTGLYLLFCLLYWLFQYFFG